jgi:hypothetical protein
VVQGSISSPAGARDIQRGVLERRRRGGTIVCGREGQGAGRPYRSITAAALLPGVHWHVAISRRVLHVSDSDPAGYGHIAGLSADLGEHAANQPTPSYLFALARSFSSYAVPSRLPPTYPYGLSLLCFFVRSCTCGFARIKGCRRLFIAASANSGAGEACHIIRQGIGAWRAFHTKQAKKRLVGRERHGFASAGCQRPLEVCSVWVLPAKSVAIQQLSQSFSSALPCKGPSPARCACAGCSPSASRSCASPACATLSS